MEEERYWIDKYTMAQEAKKKEMTETAENTAGQHAARRCDVSSSPGRRHCASTGKEIQGLAPRIAFLEKEKGRPKSGQKLLTYHSTTNKQLVSSARWMHRSVV